MWSLHRWVWRPQSPLFIGMPPAGALNRCRLYVLGRTLWAAITAEFARSAATQFPDYAKCGKNIRQNVRFTYLYPAKSVRNGWCAWLPHFHFGRGLVWGREDGQEENGIDDRGFRRRLLDARPGTAIDPDSDSAEDGSLRETECVLPYWRDDGSPVAFAGYVFVKPEVNQLNKITEIFLGGDTRYGLGRLRQVECTSALDVFGARVDFDRQEPTVHSCVVFAHARQGNGATELLGAQESLAGWDLAEKDSLVRLEQKPLWAPGSQTRSTEPRPQWQICENGVWQLDGELQRSSGP